MYHILIVDEEEHLLWALERNLFPEREDVEVHTAKTGEQGLEILGDESIDLLISDIKMPGEIDGFQLILRAKEMVPDARIMIITAFGTNRIQNFAERIGISHYIEKPFTVDELRSAVLEVLDEQEGFQGVLSDLELTDIIQMLCLAKRTALLHLKHRERRGRIVFDAGDVVHAEFDGEVGAEAVYEMLSLRQGDIFMQSDFEPVERTIDIGWQDLLLEGVKRTDEARMEEQRERTRQEMGAGPGAGAQPGVGTPAEEVDDVAGDEEAGEASRTKTPMGMGAPTMEEESETEASDGEGLGEESSEGMLFSEEELEEINKASEAAIEEESEELGETLEAGDEDVAADEARPESAEAGAVAEQKETEDEQARRDSSNEAGGEESADAGATSDIDSAAESDREEPAAAPRLGGSPAETMEEDELSSPERSGAFAQAPPSGGGPDIDNGVPRGAEATLGADGDAEPPVDSMGPFASAGQRADSVEPTMQEAAPVDRPESEAGEPAGGERPASQEGATGEAGFQQPEDDVGAAESGSEVRDSQHQEAAPVDRPESEAGEPAGGERPASQEGATGEANFQQPEDVGAAESGSQAQNSQHQEAGEDTGSGGAAGALDEFVDECPGLKATALISIKDASATALRNLGYGDEFDEEQLASGLGQMFSRASRAVSAFRDNNELQEVQLVLDGDYLLLRAIEGTELIHTAVVDKNISLGVALVLMREFGDEIQQ